MPRLGGAGEDSGRAAASPSRRHAAATAYAAGRNKLNLGNVVLLIAFTFILRNMFFTDYRTEEISSLRASGKSAEEISKVVPQTTTERRQTMQERLNEYQQFKKDVQMLKTEMEMLKAKVAQLNDGDNEDVSQEDGDDEQEDAEEEEEEEEVVDAEEEEEVVDAEEKEEVVDADKEVVDADEEVVDAEEDESAANANKESDASEAVQKRRVVSDPSQATRTKRYSSSAVKSSTATRRRTEKTALLHEALPQKDVMKPLSETTSLRGTDGATKMK